MDLRQWTHRKSQLIPPHNFLAGATAVVTGRQRVKYTGVVKRRCNHKQRAHPAIAFYKQRDNAHCALAMGRPTTVAAESDINCAHTAQKSFAVLRAAPLSAPCLFSPLSLNPLALFREIFGIVFWWALRALAPHWGGHYSLGGDANSVQIVGNTLLPRRHLRREHRFALYFGNYLFSGLLLSIAVCRKVFIPYSFAHDFYF